MQYDYSKLYGAMREKNIIQKQLAKYCGMSESTLNQKLKSKSEFKVCEMITIMNYLNLNLSKVDEYFFETKLVKTQETH